MQIPVAVEGQGGFSPRNSDQMSSFGGKLGGDAFGDSHEPVMNLDDLAQPPRRLIRQNDNDPAGGSQVAENAGDDDEIRCIPKVMQVTFI